MNREELSKLETGEFFYYSGVVYLARDVAHARICQLIEQGKKLPFDLQESVIFYAGPVMNGDRIISCGPTTSARMDKFTKAILDKGVKLLIGKGPRSEEVQSSLCKNKAVYALALGGCGALYAKSIVSSEIVAYPELGTEAIRKLLVDKMPLWVGIDAKGESIL